MLDAAPMTHTPYFHPAVDAWFSQTFSVPTPAQADAWPAIQSGKHVLIAAPTGSGKTLAAFLAAIDELVREGEQFGLPDETRIVYVSPLKALSNDINRNLEAPLAGIRDKLLEQGSRDVDIRTWVRTGDTPQSERNKMRKKPPHIVVTTPESLYILLGSQSGRDMLSTTRTVIVDEIHAVAGSKRGSHLSLSLERLEALVGRRLTRVGLSATQQPIEEVARFLVGGRYWLPSGAADCAIVDSGHIRKRDLAIEMPDEPLEAVMSNETWTQVYDRIVQLINEHRTTLIFVNTRRTAERICRQLTERLDKDAPKGSPPSVTAHHGSLAKELRFDAEQRLKHGQLKALVATSSLELGIDIGDVDLVCQIGSPRAINAFLQRVGRSGHAVGATPKGRLFPQSRDDLVECTALLDSVRRGELDRLKIPVAPTDVLSQQMVAEAAARDCTEQELFELVRYAHPFQSVTRESFDEIVQMLAEGFTTRRGRHGALLYHDAVNHIIKGRKGARLTAITSGGAIPDTADYQVMLEPEGYLVGTLNEDFAVESMSGDIFQLGNSSYRILRVERSTVRVEDAKGEPPTIPFWFGEAPGRTDELSVSVSRLREEIEQRFDEHSFSGETTASSAYQWLTEEVGIGEVAAAQIVAYLAAARAALGSLPTQKKVIFERFFDESGGMQLVIHSPFGSRINRAWGLALRKRFCRTFNFELQAAATEDTIILSLSGSHSFELLDVAKYLHPNTAKEILIQAMLDAPMFNTRWRWGASIALALPRFRGGKKVPPQIARMNAEDLLASVFPDQVACGENIVGDIVVPDHPLVQQTVRDCLEEAMDFDGFERLLLGLTGETIQVEARDLTEPSPLALEVLSARPYAYLDDAPLEERRTQAVMSRRWMDPQSASEIGKLDPAAIVRVREEAWPDAGTADQLHDALLWLTFMTTEELERQPSWPGLCQELITQRRVTKLGVGAGILVATERVPYFQALFPDFTPEPQVVVPAAYAAKREPDEAVREIVRGRLEGLGPTTAPQLATAFGASVEAVDGALLALEAEGSAMRGTFEHSLDGSPATTQWCDRRLLARIHRYTVKKLRAEIEPVQARDFLRFLFDWQRVTPAARMQGPDAVPAILSQLEGFDAPAGAWETEILPARIAEYEPAWLDEQCLAGRIIWTRLATRTGDSERGAAPVRSTPIALLPRRNVKLWAQFSGSTERSQLTDKALRVAEYIDANGASFYDEIVDHVGLLPVQVEEALGELVALGLVNSDSFGGLRALLMPADRRRANARDRRRRQRIAIFGMQDAGRWALVKKKDMKVEDAKPVPPRNDEAVEHICRTLLKRWGVVFWKLLEREADWLPPWRDLLMCLRRLEARGEIRGGRFVTGFSGEQFALPEAIGQLREVRRRENSMQLVALSAADPLNLVGILTPGGRLPALTGNRVLYRDGVPTALYAGSEVKFIEQLDPAEQWQVRGALLRRQVPAPLADLA
jgi:ATP-dependent helicase Lhr and Lhr-like helicase